MIDFYTTTVIHLSLEPYHNAGLTPAETQAIIESLPDPASSSLMLACEPAGINSNWSVRTMATNPATILLIVDTIQLVLGRALKQKRAKISMPPTNT